MYFELSNNLSNKFWKITRKKNIILVEYGKIGTNGISKDFKFDNIKFAKDFLNKKIKEKINKKYILKKTPVNKTPVKKTLVKKTPAKKTPVKKTPAKKTPAKKTPVKKTPVKKTPAKKIPVKKTPVKKNKTIKTIQTIKKCPLDKIIDLKTNICIKNKSLKNKIIKNKLDSSLILKKKTIKKTNFTGSGLDILFGLVYLLKTYNNVCLPLNIDEIPKDIMFSTCISFIPNILKNKSTSEFSEKEYVIMYPLKNHNTQINFHKNNFYNILKSCRKNKQKRYAIITLFLKWPSSNVLDEGNTGGHFNLLLFDFKSKTVERFETYGKINLSSEKITNKFDNLFEMDIKKELNYTYIRPLEFCPDHGFQNKEENNIINIDTAFRTVGNKELNTDPGGFCGSWSLWYANLVLKNPDIPRNKLIKSALTKMMDKNNHSLRTFIRNFSQFIIKERYKLIKEISNKNKTIVNKYSYNSTWHLQSFIEKYILDLIKSYN